MLTAILVLTFAGRNEDPSFAPILIGYLDTRTSTECVYFTQVLLGVMSGERNSFEI